MTIEDFLEELVGEIWDEDDVVDRDFIKLGGNRFRVSPRLTFGELCSRLNEPCPIPGDRPLLSLILEHFGRIPEEEESFLCGPFEITAEQVENGRVLSAEVRLLSAEELEERLAAAREEEQKRAEEEAEESDTSLLSRLIRPRSDPDEKKKGGEDA